MKVANVIKILKDAEADAVLFAQRCSAARKQLEKVEGPTPTPAKGSRPAKILSINQKRRKSRIKKAL